MCQHLAPCTNCKMTRVGLSPSMELAAATKAANYHRISNSSYILLIRTPPFSGKRWVLFVQQKCKHNEMAFLTSRSESKQVLFALGVDPTARDAGEGGGSDLVSQTTPFV